jgi:hypothetical protein
MNASTDQFILKCKRAGLTTASIAKKTGCPVEYIEKLCSHTNNGYDLLAARFTLLCEHYAMLGECLKVCGASVVASVPYSELLEVVGDEEVLKRIVDRYIILPKYTDENIEQIIQQVSLASQGG